MPEWLDWAAWLVIAGAVVWGFRSVRRGRERRSEALVRWREEHGMDPDSDEPLTEEQRRMLAGLRCPYCGSPLGRAMPPACRSCGRGTGNGHKPFPV